MKRWMWILCGILAVRFLGGHGQKIEQMTPVQLLFVGEEQGQVILKTDTGAWGRGETVEAAVKNMQEASEKKIFLETAETVLIEKKAQKYLPQLSGPLRPAAQICGAAGKMDLKQAADYLGFHRPGATLGAVLRNGVRIPELTEGKGRWHLAGNQQQTE